MAAKFFTGPPLDGPDPECVRGFGEELLKTKDDRTIPQPSGDHSHRTTPPRPRGAVRVTIKKRSEITAPPVSACAESPLAGFTPADASTGIQRALPGDLCDPGGEISVPADLNASRRRGPR